VLFTFARKAAGSARAPGIPCALSICEGQRFTKTRALSCRGKAEVCQPTTVVIPGRHNCGEPGMTRAQLQWRRERMVALSPTAIRARDLAVGILVDRRRPNGAIEASGHRGTHGASVVRRGDGANFPSRPCTPEAGTHALMAYRLMLSDMAAARLALGRRNQGNQSRRANCQRQKPDRRGAHASLPKISGDEVEPVRRACRVNLYLSACAAAAGIFRLAPAALVCGTHPSRRIAHAMLLRMRTELRKKRSSQ
jgi:hypothetical protein